MSPRTITAAALAAALAGALAYGVDGTRIAPLIGGYTVAWLLFPAALWALRGVPARHAAVLVLAGGALIAGTGLLAAPRTSDDAYRYVWDGAVQADGIAPYDYAPADPRVAHLRDAPLFGPRVDCEAQGLWDTGDACTHINRPTVVTIYPPVAQMYFLVMHWVDPGIGGLQAAGWLLAMATTAVLLRFGRDPRAAALWAWCPAVALEAVNNAHVDALGVLLTVAAFALAVRRRIAGAVLLGGGIAAKLLPAVTLPGLIAGRLRPFRARSLLAPGIAVGVAAATYLPYALWSHGSVLGYLGGYADEEGYEDPASGGRYALIRLFLPRAAERPVVLTVLALLVFALLALAVARYGDPDRPERGAAAMAGALLLVLTPAYPWYALLVVGLAALAARPEWLAVAAAAATAYPAAAYGLPAWLVPETAYGVAALAVIVAAITRAYWARDAPAPLDRDRPRRHAPA